MWILNDPYETINLSNNVDIPPVFDGKNIWIAQTTGDVICIQFWGPYSDLDNSHDERWKEAEYENFSLANCGPKVRVLQTIATGLSIDDIQYYENFLYVKSGSQLVKVNVNNFVVSTINSIDYGINSNMAIANGIIYMVQSAPTTQLLFDQQILYKLSITGSLLGTTAIPNKKQLDKRYLVIANDTLYVSSMNTREVHKFNALTGNYLTSIVINRDVERLFRIDNDVFVISSLRGKTVVGTTELATSMISQLTDSDIVNHKYGIINAGSYMADDDNYVWFVNDNGGIQRTRKFDNLTMATVSTLPSVEGVAVNSGGVDQKNGADYAISRTATGIKISGLSDITFGNITVYDIKNIFISPKLNYEYFNNGFVSINIPRYMFLIKQNSIITIRLPQALKWESSLKINQYTAVSTGGLSYKQG